LVWAVHVAGYDIANVVPIECVGGPGGEKREADEPEDNAEDVEAEDCPAVVELDDAGGGEMVVRDDDERYDALRAVRSGAR
jgi:hypothetical protein